MKKITFSIRGSLKLITQLQVYFLCEGPVNNYVRGDGVIFQKFQTPEFVEPPVFDNCFPKKGRFDIFSKFSVPPSALLAPKIFASP